MPTEKSSDSSIDYCSLNKRKRIGYHVLKRAFDIIFSTTVIVVGIIPGAVLSVFVARDTGGFPIYSQERVGRKGRTFQLYKFRTMVADADNLENYLSVDQLAEWHREHKLEDDPRITPLGRILRKTSIDEFPQFINALLGQMSVIGPRAITVEELEWFGEDKDLLLSVPPGITGLWQTGQRNQLDFASGMRQEVELVYVRNASLKLDAQIFFKTFKTMLEATGK